MNDAPTVLAAVAATAPRLWLRVAGGDVIRADHVVRVSTDYCPPLWPTPARWGLLRRTRPARPGRWDVAVSTDGHSSTIVISGHSRKWANATRKQLLKYLTANYAATGVLAYDHDAGHFHLRAREREADGSNKDQHTNHTQEVN